MAIHGLDKINANINRYVRNMDIEVQEAMEEVVDLIVEKAKAMAPVDTGKLRASVEGTVKKMSRDLITGHVEASMDYATYIEFGTKDMKAQPFLTPAIEEGLKILERELQKAHNRAAGRLQH